MGTGSSKLAPEAAGKLQASTHFDKREINQLYSTFVKECPSGRISREDLLRIYRQFFPFGDPVPFVDRLIKTLSLSSSSLSSESSVTTLQSGIEFCEYITGLSVISRGRLDEKLYWSFKFCDIDGDGWISSKDLLESIELIHHLMGNMFQIITSTSFNLSNSDSDSNLRERENENESVAATFTPQNRTEQLFRLMDQDTDGKANFEDFKRTVLEDAAIIQGFLIYDGVI